MSARPSMWTTTRHSSAVSVSSPSLLDALAVGEVRHALQRAELLEDELPLVDAAAALHDHVLDVHLDEDVLVGDLSSAPNSNSPSGQLKKLKAVSWICSRTACSRVARSMTPCSRRMPPMRRALAGLLLRGERRLELRGADRAGLHEPLAERQQLRHARRRSRSCPLRKKILPDSSLAADGERAALGAHLHQLEDVGETELLQVALEKHRPAPSPSRYAGCHPSRVSPSDNRRQTKNHKRSCTAAGSLSISRSFEHALGETDQDGVTLALTRGAPREKP